MIPQLDISNLTTDELDEAVLAIAKRVGTKIAVAIQDEPQENRMAGLALFTAFMIQRGMRRDQVGTSFRMFMETVQNELESKGHDLDLD